MNVNDVFPSKYVKAHDLGGKLITVTIRSATLEDMGFGAEAQTKPVLWFEKATKGLVLNRTNAMIIASMYGPETDAWIGKAITIYSARVKAFGAWHDAVRVKEQIPARNVGAARMPDAMQEAPPLDDEEDLLDVDEGQPPTVHGADEDFYDAAPTPPDAATATPAANPFDDATEQPQRPVASRSQLNKMHALGVEFHGGKAEWDAARPTWVDKASGGKVTSSSDLSPEQAAWIISALEKRIRQQIAAENATNGTAKVAA